MISVSCQVGPNSQVVLPKIVLLIFDIITKEQKIPFGVGVFLRKVCENVEESSYTFNSLLRGREFRFVLKRPRSA